MKRFAELIRVIDSTNRTNRKVETLAKYFIEADDSDKVWTIAILSHRRPSRPINSTFLREYASELANIPLWLFEESYHIVGDLAETIALVVPKTKSVDTKSLTSYLNDLIHLKGKSDEEKRAYMRETWVGLDYYERFVFTKLLTGGFRIGVSQKLMKRALSKATGIDEDVLAFRLMGNWDPKTTTFQEITSDVTEKDITSRPYPFFLAYAIEGEPKELGNISDYYAEHKWDGIRSQVILRGGELFVWSRGEELVTDKYPEFSVLVEKLPDGTVIDGEILPFTNGNIGTFNDLQKRIGRKTVSKSLLQNVPVILKAYDLLEYGGVDIRNRPYTERRKLLDEIYNNADCDTLHLSPLLEFDSWDAAAIERSRSREERSEGLMIKRKDAQYGVGRKKGDWWKWKVDPLTIDAVLTYAMRGHGRRSNLFTDYTFGLWKTNTDGTRELVTFAKAYSGLTDEEFRKVDAFIKKNTVDRFGPVRSVIPELVFEIAFEGIAKSSRHKSGMAVRFPRIHRWRTDKNPNEANSLEDLRALIVD